jgi:hypothetical protein
LAPTLMTVRFCGRIALDGRHLNAEPPQQANGPDALVSRKHGESDSHLTTLTSLCGSIPFNCGRAVIDDMSCSTAGRGYAQATIGQPQSAEDI